MDKDRIYSHPGETFKITLLMAAEAQWLKPQIIVEPEKGGIILSQLVALHLLPGIPEVLCFYAEKTKDDEFVFKRADAEKIIPSKRVLIVEDIVNTGKSVKKVADAVRAINGNLVGIMTICLRGKVDKEDLGYVPEFIPLTSIPLEAYSESDCPLCKNNIPISTEAGKGKEFLARKGI